MPTLSFLLKRILWLIALCFALSYGCFALVHLSKGSVVFAKSPQGLSVGLTSQIESNLNLDKPLNTQYFLWLKGAVRGDFSHSLISGERVSEIIKARITPTLILGFVSLGALFALSLALAILGVAYKDSALDRGLNLISISFLATPPFALGLICIMFFSVSLGILPSSGIADIGFEDDLGNRMAHLILPVCVLVLSHLGLYLRFFRTILLESLNQPFIEVAFARGLKKRDIYLRLVLKSALSPMLVYFGANAISFLVNIYVVEGVFNYGGLGNLIIQSIYFKDYPLILAIIILSFVATTFINLCVEIAVQVLDSRKYYA